MWSDPTYSFPKVCDSHVCHSHRPRLLIIWQHHARRHFQHEHCGSLCCLLLSWCNRDKASGEGHHVTQQFRCFNKLDTQALQSDLRDIVESHVSNLQDVNSFADEFTTHFYNIWNQHAPLIFRRVQRKQTQWMTDDVLHSIQRRNAAYKVFLQKRSQENHMAYKQQRNQISRLIFDWLNASFLLKGPWKKVKRSGVMLNNVLGLVD